MNSPGSGAAPASQSRATQPTPGVFWGVLAVTVVYVLGLWLTKPLNWADSNVYAPEIVDYFHGKLPLTRFYDFAHLTWRPIGYFLWQHGGFYSAADAGWKQLVDIYKALRVPSIVLGYVAILAVFAIAVRISRSVRTAVILAAAFLASNAVMNYFQVGTAYIPGLSFQLAALYLLLVGPNGKRAAARAWLAGLFLAVSVCFWLPYLLGIPGVLLMGFCWDRPSLSWNDTEGRARLRWLAQVVAAFLLVVFVVFGSAMLAAGIRSVAGFKAWQAESRHGVSESKNYLRVVTGLSRSLIELGQDGVALKRFVLHDPYNHVGILDLVRLSLWKIGLFYIAVACLVWSLLRDRAARGVMIALFLNAGIMIAFAVFVFEPTQSERWLPVFAVLFAAIAFVFRSGFRWRAASAGLAVALALAALHNVTSYAAPADPGPGNPAIARMSTIGAALVPHSMVTLATSSDNIPVFLQRYPFHRFNGENPVPIFVAISLGSSASGQWREAFAGRALQAWQEDGDVWLSKHLLDSRPASETGWAEGDDPSLSWRDVHEFFSAFALDREVGGADGFMRLSSGQANQQRLTAAASAARTPGGGQ